MAHPEVKRLEEVILAARRLIKPDAIVIREAVEEAEAEEAATLEAATNRSQPTV